MVTTFYLNLDKDEDRRASIESQLAGCGQEGIRIRAVNGRELPEWATTYFPESRLSAGEIGCYASHLLAMRTLLEQGHPFAVVLEDDASFAADSFGIIEEIVNNLPADWDFVHLAGKKRARPFAFRPLIQLTGGRWIVRYSRVPASCAAYLISSSGARKLLLEVPRFNPIDSDTRMPWNWGLEVYGVERGPFVTRDFESSINAQGGKSRLRRGLGSLKYGFRSWDSFCFNLSKLGFRWWLWCWIQNVAHKTVRTILGSKKANRLLPLKCPVE